MGLFDASTSASGSINTASNGSQSTGSGYSVNYPATANANAAAAAELAFQRQKELNQMTMDFNREEAEKQRNWEAEMANTIYTRSVKNMREAGINPVLAAGMGLSGASVSSGATASFGGSSAPLSQTFMGSESANSSQSSSWGESNGSSWSNSESGLATFLNAMGTWVQGAIGALSSSHTINIALQGLEDFVDSGQAKEVAKDSAIGGLAGLIPGLGNLFSAGKTAKKIVEKAKEGSKG